MYIFILQLSMIMIWQWPGTVLSKTHASGSVHHQQKDSASTIKELRKAVANDPQSAIAHQQLGEAYFAQGTYEMMGEAKSEFVQALAIDPSLIWSRFYLARIYIDLGFPQKAADQLNEALKNRPNTPHHNSLLGEAERQLGNPQKSVELNKLALQYDPAFFPARYYLALGYIDLKMESEAIKELDTAAQSNAPIPDIYLTLGSIHFQKGNLDSSIQYFRKAVSIAPARPEAHLKLGQVYNRQKKFDLALQALKLAFPDSQRVMNTAYYQKLQAEVFYEMGLIYREKKNLEEAEKAFAKARELYPAIHN